MVDAETQTTDDCGDGSLEIVMKDHTYCKVQPDDPPDNSSFVICVEKVDPKHEKEGAYPTHTEQIAEYVVEDFMYEDDHDNDPTFEPHPEEMADDEVDEEWSSAFDVKKFVYENKYIVFESCLDRLFYRIKCHKCFSSVVSINKVPYGTGMLVTLKCIDDHEVYKWTSQPVVGKMHVGNLLSASSILYSGLTFSRLSSFASLLNLQFFSKTLYSSIQRDYLVPEVNACWETHQKALLNTLQSKPLNLVGDGRCDSPGFSAKYCSYSLMDIETNKIIDMHLTQVSDTGSSVRMEGVAFDKCFSRVLNDYGMKVEKFATDRHTGIRKLMRTKYSDVKHNFDVFHLAKNVSAKLRKLAKKKGFEEIEGWIKSINNHMWFCARSCNNDPVILIEMWQSLMYHITNEHVWDSDSNFKTFRKCSHAPLDAEISRLKKWIVKGSPVYMALEKELMNKRLLKDLEHIADFMHTGALEVFHNVVLKYAPKRLHFDYPQMIARLRLAALDHNYNTGRGFATVKEPRAGSSAKGDVQYKKVFTKLQKEWVVKPVFEAKSYQFAKDMIVGVVKRKVEKRLDTVSPAPAKNIAPVPAPPKDVLIAKRASRF